MSYGRPQQQGYAAPGYGYPGQQQPAPGYGYGQPPAPYYGAPPPTQYAQPPPQQVRPPPPIQQQPVRPPQGPPYGGGAVGRGAGGYTYSPPTSRGDVKNWNGKGEWRTSMCTSCCAEPIGCLTGYLCPWCCVCSQRKKLLMQKMENYECCAGMWGPSCTERCNKCTKGNEELCLCLESFCCLGCAVHGNRWMVMQHYGLRNECCDLCLMYAACICSIIACLLQNEFLENLADMLFYIVVGCMIAQHQHQMVECGYPMGQMMQ